MNILHARMCYFGSYGSKRFYALGSFSEDLSNPLYNAEDFLDPNLKTYTLDLKPPARYLCKRHSTLALGWGVHPPGKYSLRGLTIPPVSGLGVYGIEELKV